MSHNLRCYLSLTQGGFYADRGSFALNFSNNEPNKQNPAIPAGKPDAKNLKR